MRRGEDNPVNHVLLRESILQSVAYLQSKVYLQEKEVYELVRAFFKEYLGLDYEFTHEELLIELQNVFYDKGLEDKVLTFLRTISKIEYSDEELKISQLKSILSEFSLLVDLLIKSRKKSKSFFKRLFSRKEKEPQIPAEKEEEEEIAEVIEDMEKNVSVDMKKDLFSNKPKIKEEKRIIEDNKESKHAKILEPTPEEVKEEKPVSSGLSALTQELNTHIETENASKHGKQVIQQKPLTQAEPLAKTEETPEEVFPKKEPLKTGEMPMKKETEPIPKKTTPLVEQKNNSLSPKNILPKKKPLQKSKLLPKKAAKKQKPLKILHGIDEMLIEIKKNPSKELYKDLQAEYDMLSEEKKAKYYKEVMDAYNLVKK